MCAVCAVCAVCALPTVCAVCALWAACAVCAVCGVLAVCLLHATRAPWVPYVLCVPFGAVQGQTFDRVGVLLPGPVFSHGQAYVALSRCGNQKHIHILLQPGAWPDENTPNAMKELSGRRFWCEAAVFENYEWWRSHSQGKPA